MQTQVMIYETNKTHFSRWLVKNEQGFGDGPIIARCKGKRTFNVWSS